MDARSWAVRIGLAVWSAVVVVHPGPFPAQASAVARVEVTDATTLYLPEVALHHNPGYVSPFGVTMFGGVGANSGLNEMRDAGSDWVMIVLDWNAIQPTQSAAYDWSSFDSQVQAAADAGASAYVLLMESPSWARANGSPSRPRGPLNTIGLAELTELAGEMAARYNGQNGHPRVDYWSFFGEPDYKYAWGDNPGAYADMLAVVAPAVHTGNPGAKVLIGGLAYEFFTDDTTLPESWRNFVRAFLPNTLQALNQKPGGAGRYVDALAFHYYPVGASPWPTIKEKAAELKGILGQYGLARLPLIVPEVSAFSQGLHGQTAEQQASRLVQFYLRGISVGVQTLFWFQVFDLPADVSEGDEVGLFSSRENVRNLDNPRPSYYAYWTLAHELDRADYLRALDWPGVEGYVFRRAGRETSVLWSTAGTPVQAQFALTCVRLVTRQGLSTVVPDGNAGAGDLDGVVNGLVTLAIPYDTPVYVGPCP